MIAQARAEAETYAIRCAVLVDGKTLGETAETFGVNVDHVARLCSAETRCTGRWPVGSVAPLAVVKARHT